MLIYLTEAISLRLLNCPLITRNYWWPSMTTFVKAYVTGCDICQRMKNKPQQPYGPLLPNKVPEGPWEVITIYLITQLPGSDGYDAICVIVDRFTKHAHFYAITNEFSAKDLARLLYDRIYPLHGLPLQIISDRGTQFTAELFQEWCKLLRTNLPCLQHITHRLMDRQKGLTKKQNSIYTSTLTINSLTGLNGQQSQSLH